MIWRRRADLLAVAKIPHRQHVAVADGAVVVYLEHAELDRIERVDAARPPQWPLPGPRIGCALLLELLAHDRNEDEPIEQTLHPGQLDLGCHRRDQVVGGV